MSVAEYRWLGGLVGNSLLRSIDALCQEKPKKKKKKKEKYKYAMQHYLGFLRVETNGHDMHEFYLTFGKFD
jgi:hypothetical protein